LCERVKILLAEKGGFEMQVYGTVLKIRESSFAAKKTGERIEMVYFDLYDATAGVVSCETRKNGLGVVMEGQKISAEVVRLKKLEWGTGLSLVVRDVRELDGGVPSFNVNGPAVSAPARAAVPPAPPQTVSKR